MPRHGLRLDEEIAEVKCLSDRPDDDGYDMRQHPSSKRAKEIKNPVERNRYVEEEHVVPRAHHGLLIGPKGSKLRELEAQTKCQLDIPRREQNSDTVYVCGGEADVRRAKGIIDELIKESELLALRRSKSGELQETAKAQVAFPALPGEEKVVMQLDVEKFAHGKFIGRGASRLHDLKKRLTVTHENAVFDIQSVDIVVPLRDDVSSIISLHLPKSLVSRAEKIVRDFFFYYEIQAHLRDVKIVEGLSMVGNDAPQQSAQPTTKPNRKSASKRKEVGDGGKAPPSHGAPPVTRGGSGEAAGAGGSVKSDGPGEAATLVRASGGQGEKEEAPAVVPRENQRQQRDPEGGLPKASKATTPAARNVRKPRPPHGTLTNHVEVGYTHTVLPQRCY